MPDPNEVTEVSISALEAELADATVNSALRKIESISLDILRAEGIDNVTAISSDTGEPVVAAEIQTALVDDPLIGEDGVVTGVLIQSTKTMKDIIMHVADNGPDQLVDRHEFIDLPPDPLEEVEANDSADKD